MGNCGPSASNPAHNNISTIDPYPDVGDKYLVGGTDPTVPGYYALNNLIDGLDGVDDGFDSFVLAKLPNFAGWARFSWCQPPRRRRAGLVCADRHRRV
ncbi:MAG: hypothetical protein HND48_20300 [Chloroflexi bacterium]|nr:hypothetical protein [Chloroflexota bacterium]